MSTDPLPQVSHDLTGTVALVTGASSGIGRRMALVLAGAGAEVAVVARRSDELGTLVGDIESRGGRAHAIVADLSEPASPERVVADCGDALGVPSILVNNAGMPDARRAHRMPTVLVDQVLSLNLRAPYLLSCAVARGLIEQGLPGRIVNITSMLAFHYAGEGAALYSVTKAALNRMTETLAVEWAKHRINVNAIAPGCVDTDLMAGMIERVGDVTADFPRHRLCAPAQLDGALLFLVAPTSETVTGTVVKVDDGQFHR